MTIRLPRDGEPGPFSTWAIVKLVLVGITFPVWGPLWFVGAVWFRLLIGGAIYCCGTAQQKVWWEKHYGIGDSIL